LLAEIRFFLDPSFVASLPLICIMQRACRASTLYRQISALARFRGRPEHGLTQALACQEVIGARDMARSANYGVKHMSSAPMPSKAGQGFFYPGPRQLKDIVKLPLLNAHGASRVREIWTEFHRDHKSAVADILTADEFGTLMQRSQRCPFFVLPVPRYVRSSWYRRLTIDRIAADFRDCLR
jgi:ATP11 protein